MKVVGERDESRVRECGYENVKERGRKKSLTGERVGGPEDGLWGDALEARRVHR